MTVTLSQGLRALWGIWRRLIDSVDRFEDLFNGLPRLVIVPPSSCFVIASQLGRPAHGIAISCCGLTWLRPF